MCHLFFPTCTYGAIKRIILSSITRGILIEEFRESLVELRTIGESAVDDANGIDLSTNAQLLVAGTEDVLHEDIADAFLLDPETAVEFITATKRHLELHGQTCHDTIDALIVKTCKTNTVTEQKLMTCVFDIMLIIGIVDNALEVALVIANLHAECVDIISHNRNPSKSSVAKAPQKLEQERAFAPQEGRIH